MDFKQLDLACQAIFKDITNGRDFHRAVRDKFDETIRMTLGFCNICFDVHPDNTLMIFDNLCNNQFIDWSSLPMYYFEDFEGNRLNMMDLQKNLLSMARREVKNMTAETNANFALATALQNDATTTFWTTGAFLNQMQKTTKYNPITTYKVIGDGKCGTTIEVDPFDTISSWLCRDSLDSKGDAE